jgi:hypothetical protein
MGGPVDRHLSAFLPREPPAAARRSPHADGDDFDAALWLMRGALLAPVGLLRPIRQLCLDLRRKDLIEFPAFSNAAKAPAAPMDWRLPLETHLPAQTGGF